MEEIFISYKVHNRKTAIEYYKYLKDRGLNPWFDQLIPKGSNWNDTIKRHIKKSKIVICLVSFDSLKDDWVYNQVKFARKYNKKIYFINIDNTEDTLLYKKFKIEEIYYNINEIDFDNVMYDNLYLEYKDKQLEISKYNKTPYLIIIIMALISIYLLCYGFSIFNILLRKECGYIGLGITITYLLSLIPNRIISIVKDLLGIVLLIISMYVIQPYYIFNISINPLFFMFLYFLCFIYINTRKNIFLSTLYTIFYMTIFVGLAASIMIFSEHIFNFDASLICLLITSFHMVYIQVKNKKYFSLLNEYKIVKSKLKKDYTRRIFYEN